MPKAKTELESLFDYVFQVVDEDEDDELRICDHTESWQPPHACPLLVEVHVDHSQCVCCEDCQEECYIGI